MDLPIWCILSAMLLAAAQAGMTDQGPQMFSDPKSIDTPQLEKKQHKREPKLGTKEVILYLTPSQIRAYESGKGLMTHQQAVQLRNLEESQGLRPLHQTSQFDGFRPGQGLEQTQPKTQLDLSPLNEQLKEQMQNAFNDAGQKLQKEAKELENEQKKQIQKEESNKSIKEQEQGEQQQQQQQQQQLSPENSELQAPKLELQKREKYIELPVPLQFIPHSLPSLQQHGIPTGVPQFEQQFVVPAAHQIEQQPVPSIPVAEPQLQYLPLHQEQRDLHPQNYAYLYFYPQQKPITAEKNPHFYPHLQRHKPAEFFIQREHHPISHLHPKFQLVPYEYGYDNKLEAQQILQAQLDEHHFDAHQLEAHKLEAHQFEENDSQQLLVQKQLEPQYPQQYERLNLDEHKYEPQEIKLKIIPHTASLLAQPSKEIKIDLKKLNSIRQKEMKELYEAQKLKAKLEAEEKEAKRLDEQLKEEELKVEQFKAEQLKDELFKNYEIKQELFKNDQFREELFKDEQFKEGLFKTEEIKETGFKDDNFRGELFKPEELKESSFNYDNFKDELFKNEESNEEIKNEKFKEELLKNEHIKEQFRKEYQDLAYLQKLEPKRTQMYSILNPLFQGHSIVESLEKQKTKFPHHNIHLQTGFKPLQYAPKFNDKKHEREIEKLLQRNRIEKQKALAKAAAIANEPPEIIHGEVVKSESEPIFKEVETRIPSISEVKLSRPYSVPTEIVKPYPILKIEKVEPEEPASFEIEKQLSVPVLKSVYEKPYYVQKAVPLEVKRDIPVEFPGTLQKPIKLSIIKHVWKH